MNPVGANSFASFWSRPDAGPEAVYVIGPDQHLTAAYYRNTIIHFFVNASVFPSFSAFIDSGESNPVSQ